MQNYLNIGKSAKHIGVSVDTLRRWEVKGIIKSRRSHGGHRYFLIADLESVNTQYTHKNRGRVAKNRSVPIGKKRFPIYIYGLIFFVVLDIILISIYIYNQ